MNAPEETPTPEARTPGSVGRFAMYKKQTAPPAGTVTVGSLVQKVTEGIMVPDKVAQGAAVARMRSLASQQRAEKLQEENRKREKERDEKRARNKRQRTEKRKNRR